MTRIFQIVCAVAAVFLIAKLDVLGGLWEPDIGAKLAPGNEVVMYSLTTCGYCTAKRKRLTAAGIPFTEHFMDTDQARWQEFARVLQANNMPPGRVGTPTFVVNGVLLVNNPGMETIRKHLKFRAPAG